MTKLLNSLCLVFLLLLSSTVTAQDMKIEGTVYDSTGKIPLPNAIAMAVRMKDSLLLGFSHSDAQGKFFMKGFQVDTFTLVVIYPNCEDKNYFIFGNSANSEITIPSIIMQPEAQELETVVIYANKNPIFYRGDTLVYVADSFKVAQNAVVEDLLKKLPGIKVEKDGKIKSQGKEITQVLVDGDEFFGSDPTIATKNLGANGVKSVEVYEKKNENAVDGGDETIQVMNLKLKDEAKKGYFGRTSLASDFNRFYEGELLFNKFNGSQKISVFALGSNTPRSGFGWGDLNKFGLDNEFGTTINDEGEVQWNGNQNSNGVPKTFKSGIYFSDRIGKNNKTKIGFNYTFNDYQLNAVSKSRSQYFLGDTTYFSDDSTHNFTHNQSHTLNFTLSSQLDSLTTIEFKPKLTYSTGSTDNTDNTRFLSEDENLTRITNINNKNDSKGYTLNNEASILRKFKKPKRELGFKYTISASGNNSIGKLFSTNSYFDGSFPNDTTDQSKLNQNTSQTHIGKLNYTEPLNKKFRLEFDYMYEYGLSSQNKETRNKLNGDYTVLNLNYSNKFDNTRQQNRFGTVLIYQTKKYTIGGGSRVRNIDIMNNNLITGLSIHQNFTNILPRFTFVFNPTMNKRFSLHYTTNATQPSINDLQPVPDNSNPNRIAQGNPSLKPSYSHKVNINLNTWQAMSGRYVYLGINSALTNNDFANSTAYDPNVIGKMISQTVNVNGNYYANIYGGAGIPIYKKVLAIHPNINGNYSSFASFINGEKNITQSRSMGGDFELAYNGDSLQVSLSVNGTYTSPKNSISSFSSQPYSTVGYYAGVNWTLPWKMKISTDATYTINGHRANGYNISYLIWNAEISRNFLKTQNLVLSIRGNDILNQNISAQRQVNGNVITDNKTKIISRYFLLKLTMKFNNNKTKESDGSDGWD